jgi:AraC family transcriptional regulator of adaptative response / methylphosphotriester-DNA alkyltransferase methyltransferase
MTDPSLPGMHAQTVTERRRVYLLARLAVKRHYARHLTLRIVAEALATSPRQLQRAYAQLGEETFREDLITRRLTAAAELLTSQRSTSVRAVAHQVGYPQPTHFARAFRRRYGVSPSTYRAESRQATGNEATAVTAA